MSQDDLGLFDTPPTRHQTVLGSVMAGGLLAVLPVLMIVPDEPLHEIDSVVPVIDAIMLLSDLVTATLLYVQAAVFRSRALAFLASSFVAIALLLLVHMLSYPGAFAPQGVVGGGLSTTGWTYLIRRGALPLAVVAYVVLRRAEAGEALGRGPLKIWLWLLSAIAFAGLVTLLVTAGHDLLPSLFADRLNLVRSNLVKADAVLIALTLGAIAFLFLHRRSVLDVWLLVAMVAWFIDLPMNIQHSARFTTGFYIEYGVMPVSNLILMLALIAESSRLYTRLALSNAAQQRERDARLMSADVMAATFSHEIGQPLAALTLNAEASLKLLASDPPRVDKARDALRGAVDEAHRAKGILQSIGSLFANKPGKVAQFNINELVRQTAVLLERELLAANVFLQLSLDERLPPVRADPIQIQQVLVNLTMNAIEALGETRGRPRRIVFRSMLREGPDAVVEVSDNGIGIPEADLERIFEPFITTKTTGTGLGLPICRAIAEDHGGRLWASPKKGHGATFHLQLPCVGAPQSEPLSPT